MSETSRINEDEVPPTSPSTALLGLFDPPHVPTVLSEEKKSSNENYQSSTNDTGLPEFVSQDASDSAVNPNEQSGETDTDTSAGSLSHFMNLFAPPVSSSKPDIVSRQSTVPRSNRSSSASKQQQEQDDYNDMSEATPLLDSSSSSSHAGMHTPQSSMDWRDENSQKMFLSMMGADTPKIGSVQRRKDYNTGSNSSGLISPSQKYNNGSHNRLLSSSHVRMPSSAMPVISEGRPENIVLFPDLDHASNHNFLSNIPDITDNSFAAKTRSTKNRCCHYASNAFAALKQPSTYIGSFMYLLYHVVFCLALGSAIMRPNNPTSILGLMTKTAALGALAASPVYWFGLSAEIPSLYPTADLFLAPFLAGLALIVDQTLAEDASVTKDENDAIFLATFGVLTAIGITLSSCLLVAASVFKLANLGSFLPFPVICGFFAAVGILTWTLAVNVDTGGKSIGRVLTSGDTELMIYALMHHIPTLIVAGFMKYLGPKNPFFVVMVVFVTIGLFYVYMFATGTSLEEMKEAGWFWSHDELVYKHSSTTIGFSSWSPPAPFGVLMELHRVHWGAVKKGLSTAVALSFLYLIRCSVHGAALKKNVPNLSRKVRSDDPILEKNRKRVTSEDQMTADGIRVVNKPPTVKARTFSEAVDIEAVLQTAPSKMGSTNGAAEDGDDENKPQFEIYQAKPTSATLKQISLSYGKSQIVSALVGGFAITPSVAASSTMFSLGAESLAPQIGSVLLLFVFYTSDFQIVGYIPKPAFSSMLVLAFIDMINTWFYKSYFKTKDKFEWMVVPAIVVCAFVLDLLSAVFLGIGFSTLIFVASFFRSGVVKYVANGKCINSTIERPFRMSEWLNEEGDLIQVLCLQNYLFFGNASSVFSFIGVCFESNEAEEISTKIRKPEYLILDLTLVTGMDTSTVDVFSDIRNLCRSNNCKLLMAGMSPNIRSILALGNFKPDAGVRSKRQLRFFPNLDAALGKAEDMLLEARFVDPEPQPSLLDRRRKVLDKLKDNGFRTALGHIDAEHGENFSLELVGLQEYTTAVELETGELLYEDGQSKGLERGLFFIESGILKVEHYTDQTATRGTQGSIKAPGSIIGGLSSGGTIKSIQQLALQSPLAAGGQTFRLARIGVGWVAGTMEFFHMKRPGSQVAVDHCKLHHLPFSKIEEVENKNPHLALTLYKLLSYLMARRQEATIGQLATLHSIMTSPPRWRSLGRKPPSNLK